MCIRDSAAAVQSVRGPALQKMNTNASPPRKLTRNIRACTAQHAETCRRHQRHRSRRAAIWWLAT
eukprot:4320594-Alexandrium_andersonii.AAC.1